MKLQDAKQQFIAAWGSFGSNWGINRTMAQIHALLLISTNPISADDVMRELAISRGNVNMNLRDLIDWGLADRVIITGERKEFFTGEKDIWKVARTIIRERKKRELEPMLKFLDTISQVDGDKNDKDIKEFTATIANIKKFSQQADKTLSTMIKAEETWLVGTMMKLFK
jgi:DNA-binding transcriptional regulator GbsR (MarR family)